MASEKPQSLPLEDKKIDPAPSEEMEVDEPVAETVNG